MKAYLRIITRYLASLAIAIAPFTADAENGFPDILGPAPKNRASLLLYDTPQPQSSTHQMPITAFRFPLSVLDIREGFQKIQLDGKNYWLRSGQVQNATSVRGHCLSASTKITSAPTRIGAAAGITTPVCP